MENLLVYCVISFYVVLITTVFTCYLDNWHNKSNPDLMSHDQLLNRMTDEEYRDYMEHIAAER